MRRRPDTELIVLAPEVPELNYFPPTAKKRVLVVFTDGETRPLEGGLVDAFQRRPRIHVIFMRFWGAGERIYETGVVEGEYRPDPRTGALLDGIASSIGGRVFSEGQNAEAAVAAREAIGGGPTVDRRQEGGRLALMPYVTLAALVPLVLVLLARNVWWEGVPRFRRRTGSPEPKGAEVAQRQRVVRPG